MGVQEPGPAAEAALPEGLGKLDGPGDEPVAECADPFHHCGNVRGQGLRAPNPRLCQEPPARIAVGGGEQRLGGHAADAGTGGPIGAVIDQHHVVGVTLRLL